MFTLCSCSKAYLAPYQTSVMETLTHKNVVISFGLGIIIMVLVISFDLRNVFTPSTFWFSCFMNRNGLSNYIYVNVKCFKGLRNC